MRASAWTAVIAAAGSVGVASSAAASSIAYRCGSNLCRIDPETKRVARLTRDGHGGKKARSYGSPSLSCSGARLSFTFGNDLWVARGDGRKRRRLDRNLVLITYMRPDGKQVAYGQSIFSLVVVGIDPSSNFFTYIPYLRLRPLDSGKSISVARSVVTAGWLGNRLLRDDERSGGRGDEICVLRRNADDPCAHAVAAESRRDVSQPSGSPDGRYVATVTEPHSTESSARRRFAGRIALFRAATGAKVRDITRGTNDSNPTFSPDGRSIAFNRGRDLYIVRTSGRGAPRRLRRNAIDPTWGARQPVGGFLGRVGGTPGSGARAVVAPVWVAAD